MAFSFESVLCFFVSSQVYFPLESFSTEITAEWFEPRVFSAVGYEIGALTECLPTHLTFMRLLTWGMKTFTLPSCQLAFHKQAIANSLYIPTNLLGNGNCIFTLVLKIDSTCLCGWMCAFSCLISDGISCRKTGMGKALCQNGWEDA